jgi:hypothetical protein
MILLVYRGWSVYRAFVLMLTFVVLLTAPVVADWLAWDYDLRSPPPSWYFDEQWEFEPEGVRMSEYVSTPYVTEWGNIFTAEIIVPDYCDSIVFHVEQDVDVRCSGNGYASAKLKYRVNGGDWIDLFSAVIWYQSTQPIHEHIPAEAGGFLAFRFEGIASKGNDMYPGWGDIDWLLYDLNLTFYGELVSFEQTTWASIKYSLH